MSLDNEGRVALRMTGKRIPCSWTGTMLEEETQAVAMESLTGTKPIIWVGVSGIESFQRMFIEFDEESYEDGDEIDTRSLATYSHVKEENSKMRCIGTNDEVHVNDEVLTFKQYELFSTGVGVTGTVHCHVSCLPALVETLDNVWEQADTLLGSQL